MDRTELQALIDRVIGKKGILRAPAWWANKALNNILDYCEGLTPKIEVEAEVNDSENPVSSGAVKGYVDTAIEGINSTIGDINTTIGDLNAEILKNEEVIAAALVNFNARLKEFEKRLDNAQL